MDSKGSMVEEGRPFRRVLQETVVIWIMGDSSTCGENETDLRYTLEVKYADIIKEWI